MRITRKDSKKTNRIYRHKKVRMKVQGTKNRPRLSVFRSNRYIYAQIIDDEVGQTIVAASSKEIKLSDEEQKKGQKITAVEKAYRVGQLIAEKCLQKGITKIVFDRNGYAYHGKVKALADGARDKKIEF
jgi:large subunit ribosomal protein L18